MLDDTMGPAAMAFLGGKQLVQTLELKVNFIRHGKVGPIFGEGRVVHHGRDIMFLEGALKHPDGKIIATSTATARILSVALADQLDHAGPPHGGAQSSSPSILA